MFYSNSALQLPYLLQVFLSLDLKPDVFAVVLRSLEVRPAHLLPRGWPCCQMGCLPVMLRCTA